MSHGLQHAFEAEEVMAYLDGALEADRAAALAAHLDTCAECQALAKNFRQLTDKMMSFEVEPAPQSINDAVLKAVEKHAATTPPIEKRPILKRFDFWNWPLVQRVPRNWAIGGAIGAVALVLLLVYASAHNSRRMEGLGNLVSSQSDLALYMRQNASPAPPSSLPASSGKPSRFDESTQDYLKLRERQAIEERSSNIAQWRADNYVATASEESVESDDQSDAKLAAPDVKGPMIEQNVSLHIVPSNYDDASATIEKLASAHGGYVGTLTATAQTGSARGVNVELRIPAKQSDAFIADVRKLGKVVEETRTTEEVTAEYVDLQARMKASKAAEQRLVELLGTRTGKLSDVLEVERELARVRSEIESMQGQANVMLHEVNYATVKVELSEEYHETLHSDSVGSKLRDAFVGGLKNLEDGIVGALIFVLEDGLSIAFWGGILLAIALVVRRRIRSRRAASEAVTAAK
jgi:hypothetical protein